MAVCFKNESENRQWSRKNGWSPPYHQLQILAWFFLLLFATLYFGVLTPALPSGPIRLSAIIINAIIFVFHAIIQIISTTINPADDAVRAKNHKGPLPTFDRSKHAHVIENQFCYICEVKVNLKSKHCSSCNKCVADFDHHCKWLNNCVGGKNYRLFFTCVTTGFIGSTLILITALYIIYSYFIYGTLVEAGVFWVVMVFITAFLAILAIGLLGHLLGFHFYLLYRGMTTFEYIISKRDGSSSTTSSSDNNEDNSSRGLISLQCVKQIFTKKANQISPTAQNSSRIEESKETVALDRFSFDDNKITSNALSAIENGQIESLEKAIGDVYIGSPKRIYLPPLKPISTELEIQDSAVLTKETGTAFEPPASGDGMLIPRDDAWVAWFININDGQQQTKVTLHSDVRKSEENEEQITRGRYAIVISTKDIDDSLNNLYLHQEDLAILQPDEQCPKLSSTDLNQNNENVIVPTSMIRCRSEMVIQKVAETYQKTPGYIKYSSMQRGKSSSPLFYIEGNPDPKFLHGNVPFHNAVITNGYTTCHNEIL